MVGYGTERHIGIVGAKSSGKSFLLYTGLDMLMTERKMSQTQATPETDIRLNKARIDNGQMPPTPKNMYTAIQLLFKKRRLRLVPYHLFFYDIAGEEFDGTNFDQGRIKFFRNVRTVVLVIDPLRVKYPMAGSNRKFVDMVNRERQTAYLRDDSEKYDLNEVTANFIAMLNRSGGIKPKDVNVDIVCTKAEMYDSRGYFDAFGMDYQKASSSQIRAFVKNTMGLGSFVQLVENEFKVRGYWAVDVKSRDKKPVRQLFNSLLKQSGVLGNWWRSLLSILMTVAVAGALATGGYFGYRAIAEYIENRPVKQQIEAPVALVPNYYCKASSLNVRSAASANASIVGQLKQGEEVYVHSIDPVTNFAKIDYSGDIAYVSAKYLVPKKESSMPSAISGLVQQSKEEKPSATTADRHASLFVATQTAWGRSDLRLWQTIFFPVAVSKLYDKVTSNKELQYFDEEKYPYDILRFTLKGSVVMVATIYDGQIGAIDVVGKNIRSLEGLSPGLSLSKLVGAGAGTMITNDTRIYCSLGGLLYTIDGELTVDGFRKVRNAWQSGVTVRLQTNDYDPGAMLKA